MEELSRQRDLLRLREENVLQREAPQIERKQKASTASVSSKDLRAEMQSQIAYMLNQQAMMQQNFSTVVRDFKSEMVAEMKTAFRELVADSRKQEPLAGPEHLPRTSRRMGDAPHPPPLLEPAVSYVVPP